MLILFEILVYFYRKIKGLSSLIMLNRWSFTNVPARESFRILEIFAILNGCAIRKISLNL